MAAFPDIEKIQYEGPDSTNPLAFRWYNEEEEVEGKTMKEHLRFSVVYWHTFRGTGMDPFGSPTMQRPWEDGTDSVENAIHRARVAFEFMEKLGAPYYAFHDRDVAPEGRHWPSPTGTWTRWSMCWKKSSSGPGPSCSGGRPTCLVTLVTCTGRRPAAMPTPLPMPDPR